MRQGSGFARQGEELVTVAPALQTADRGPIWRRADPSNVLVSPIHRSKANLVITTVGALPAPGLDREAWDGVSPGTIERLICRVCSAGAA